MQIIHGNSENILEGISENSIDCIVTDPPYEIGFMGRNWDMSGIAYSVEFWAKCLKVLKPGGYLLSFGGSRTYHRIACAIEDAGFQIRDQIMWIYGSGFPKNLDVSKAIDKKFGAIRETVRTGKAVKRMIPGSDQNKTGSWIKNNGRIFTPSVTVPATEAAKYWHGWGTALKPAHEPICIARKPLSEKTVTDNLLKYGTGAINIEGCRVPLGGEKQPTGSAKRVFANNGFNTTDTYGDNKLTPLNGRFPANVIHDGSDEVLDLFPNTKSSGDVSGNELSDPIKNVYSKFKGRQTYTSRADSGSAARFFYCAKASTKEKGENNNHPTVKPLSLMRYLVRMVCPTGGCV